MLALEVVPNGWTTEGYCKAGSFTSRSFYNRNCFGKILSDIGDLPHEI